MTICFAKLQLRQPEQKQAKSPVLPAVEGPSAFPSALTAAVGDVKTMKVTLPGSPSTRKRVGSNASDRESQSHKHGDMSRNSSSSSTNSTGQVGKSPSFDILRPKKFQRVNKAEAGFFVVAEEDFRAHELEELPFGKGDKVEGKKPLVGIVLHQKNKN